MEAMATVILLGVLMTMVLYVANGVREFRVTERAWLEARSAMTSRAERLRVADYDHVASLDRETTSDLSSGVLHCRLTTRVAESPRRPGLLTVTVAAELLDDEGTCLRRGEIELLRAARQWEGTP